jgi:uncharacterized protein (TIGR04255 family)
MPVPEADRVLYERNPLDEVICQLRFPPILRLDSEPVVFQEAMRAEYPFYETKPSLRLPQGLPAEFMKIIGSELPGIGSKTHDFASRDRVWTLKLNRESLLLSCQTYDRWETFVNRLEAARTEVETEFAPAFYTRIGLRYRNIIRRSLLPESDRNASWKDLLKPWVSGILGSGGEDLPVMDSRTVCHFVLGDLSEKCILNYGLAADEKTKEPVYVFDADCYIERQTELTDVPNCLTKLNRYVRNLFHWCISDRLHFALGPQPVSQCL